MPSSTSLTNGTSNGTSKVLSHLTSYPVISDSVEGFKSNHYGRKSLDLADSAYQRLAKPVEPYLEKPYGYAKPYVAKADELLDTGLDQLDATFPIVKEDTNTLYGKGRDLVFYPFKLADDGKTYVVSTWQDEYKKTSSHNNRGAGLSTLILAIFSTELKIASDFFQAVADFLGPKYAEGKQNVQEYAAHAQEKVDEYKKKGEEYVKIGQDKGEQAMAEASSKKEEAKQKAGAK